ncbi:PrpR N-terminal domain-containing protein [Alkalihalobacillus sp. NPDC078783]
MKDMHITVIAPYEGLQKTVKRVIRDQQPFTYNVHLADLEEAIPIIQKVDDKTDLYISRGGTANVIKAHSNKQVIEIPISGYDILRTLLLIQDDKEEAEIIAFENISSDFNEISQLLGIEVPITSIHSAAEAEPAVIKAKASGRRVIIGDTVTNDFAQRYGVEGILITSGVESVKQAFEQAETIRQVHLFHDEEKELFKALATEMDESFLVVRDKEVRFKNNSLKRLEHQINVKHLLEQLFEQLENEILPNEVNYTLYDEEKPYQLKVQALGIKEYFIISIRTIEQIIPRSCSKFQTDGLTFPLVLGTKSELVNRFDLLVESNDPILILAEEGSGERCVTEALIANRLALECDLRKQVDVDELFQTQLPLFLSHLHALPESKQKEWIDAATRNKGPVVFFSDNDVNKEWFKGRTLELPALSARLEQDPSFIRTFISQANSRFGKQVIGLKNTAAEIQELSHRHSLVSFRDLIFQEVEQTQASHISLEVSQLNHEQEGVICLDLSKTLDEMESEIIQRVLKEEGFNQSKTAKRLNVNRTTIWRKLK